MINNFTPVLGNAFRILTYGSRSGIFATVKGSDLGNGLRFKVNYNATNVTLEVAPEEAIAGFIATNNSPTPLDSVTTLMATVTAGSNVIYAWSFGVGSTGNGSVVTHTYPAPGNYAAIVTATNTLGSATDTTLVNIFIASIAGLTATNNGPTPIDSVTTLAANITAGSNVTYAWNFGDGTTGNGRVVTHTYATPGNYTAIVTATNAVSSDTAMTTVDVFVVPIAGLTASNNGPTLLGNPTTLTAAVTAGSRVNYTWNFGDGTTGNGAVVNHTTAFMLGQNYPNPFNPATTFRYTLPRAEHVTLTVYNLLGKEIEKLLSEKQAAGEYTMRWNPVGLPSGVYVYRLQAGEFVATKKLILLQ